MRSIRGLNKCGKHRMGTLFGNELKDGAGPIGQAQMRCSYCNSPYPNIPFRITDRNKNYDRCAPIDLRTRSEGIVIANSTNQVGDS